jgi:hypothetical protein
MIEGHRLLRHLERHQGRGLKAGPGEGCRVSPNPEGSGLHLVWDPGAFGRLGHTVHHLGCILHCAIHIRGEDINFRMGDHLDIEQPRIQVLQLVQVASNVAPRASQPGLRAAEGDKTNFRAIGSIRGAVPGTSSLGPTIIHGV